MLFTSLDDMLAAFALGQSGTGFWFTVTLLGDTITLAAFTLLLLFIIKNRKDRITLALSFLLAFILAWSLKFLFARPRPENATLLTYAFPSGHTLGATAVYGTIALLLWRHGHRWQAAAILLIPVMVGVSRIMLHEHWATDVLGGFLLGVIVIALSVRAAGTSPPRRSRA